MKKNLLLILTLILPLIGFSQLWDFNASNQDWTKKGSGQYTVASYGTTAGNLHLEVTGTTTSNNFFVLENLVSSINAPVSNYKFLRVKLTNNSVVETMTFRADATNPSGANKSVSIASNSTTNTEYFIDLTGITWGSGAAGTYELRFQKQGANSWATSQYITIDEIEFMTDVIKNDHLFDVLDNWEGETNTANGTSIAISNGKLIVTPTGAINAKIKNDFYSLDASNKYIHILYKNNSTVNNSVRVNYFSPTDAYAAQKSFPNEYITTNGTDSELIIDANSVADWTGNIRKISVVLSSFNGTNEVPTDVNTSTLEIDRIVVNNSMTPLNTDNFTVKNTFSVYPNPVVNEVNFETNSEINNVSIYNLNGQKVLESNEVLNSKMDVSNLSQGLYIAQVTFDGGITNTTKFIKN